MDSTEHATAALISNKGLPRSRPEHVVANDLSEAPQPGILQWGHRRGLGSRRQLATRGRSWRLAVGARRENLIDTADATRKGHPSNRCGEALTALLLGLSRRR